MTPLDFLQRSLGFQSISVRMLLPAPSAGMIVIDQRAQALRQQ